MALRLMMHDYELDDGDTQHLHFSVFCSKYTTNIYPA